MRIYFIVDEKNRIYSACNWAEDIAPDPDWMLGEVEFPLCEEHAVPLWKYENGECLKRTAEEVKADIDEIPKPEPTQSEQFRADIDFLTMENEYLEAQAEQDRADIDYLLMITE